VGEQADSKTVEWQRKNKHDISTRLAMERVASMKATYRVHLEQDVVVVYVHLAAAGWYWPSDHKESQRQPAKHPVVTS